MSELPQQEIKPEEQAPEEEQAKTPGWKKALSIVEWAGIILLLVFDIFIMSMRFSSNDSGATNFFGNQVYIVLTGSMQGSDEYYAEHPEFEIQACPIDSAVFVKKAPEPIITEDEGNEEKIAQKQAALDEFYSDVKIGDILTFYYQIGKTVIVTHRVVDIRVADGKYGKVYNYTLMGDNPSGDQVVSAQSPTQSANSTTGLIIGKVTRVDMPLGWFLSNVIGNRVLIGILLIGPAAIMFIYEIGKIALILHKDYRERHPSAAEVELAALRERLNGGAPAPAQTPPPAPAPAVDPLEQLRKYKMMLDEGLITQEEYDKKKEELLK